MTKIQSKIANFHFCFLCKVGLSVGTSQHPAPHRKSGTEVVIQVRKNSPTNVVSIFSHPGKPCGLCGDVAAGGISSAQEIYQRPRKCRQAQKTKMTNCCLCCLIITRQLTIYRSDTFPDQFKYETWSCSQFWNTSKDQ